MAPASNSAQHQATFLSAKYCRRSRRAGPGQGPRLRGRLQLAQSTYEALVSLAQTIDAEVLRRGLKQMAAVGMSDAQKAIWLWNCHAQTKRGRQTPVQVLLQPKLRSVRAGLEKLTDAELEARIGTVVSHARTMQARSQTSTLRRIYVWYVLLLGKTVKWKRTLSRDGCHVV
ncbi:hypothetical protein BAUCODRAFT_578350 [Baudoinia panamericana UAMH 10762]|uniref:Uncharacterized protein n=1 Tax=Baudoinia panamericana (strain UAMH 10762) TaxID=717646 RepID=M2MS58_BAUPA|nr:uncharacterized protein BAUCODRAFT_578350 [Baudoinia panamericana UAMH 10762]EMC94338.1 hypothetical protein BAUCODRAFT_578350 [Baudoinia panamericana UAMH 10762]